MEARFVLSGYVEKALEQAVYDKLEDGTFYGSIPECPGVVAFDRTLRGCERELRSVLEDWILTGIKLGHRLPVIDGLGLRHPGCARHRRTGTSRRPSPRTPSPRPTGSSTPKTRPPGPWS